MTLDASQKFALKSNTSNASRIRDFFVTALKIVQKFHGNSQLAQREPFPIVKYKYIDTIPPDDDVLTIGIPADLRPPNALYGLHAGHDSERQHDISKYGISDNFPRRRGEHDKELVGNKVLFTINTGPYSAKPLEDTVKEYTRKYRVHMLMTKNDNHTMKWEFFQTDYKQLDSLLEGLIAELKRLHMKYIFSITFRGKTEFFNNDDFMRIRDIENPVELEMAKQITLQKEHEAEIEKARVEREKARVEREKMLLSADPDLYLQYMKKKIESGDC